MNNHQHTVASRARALRPGRNDPCPCGSGIKYKKCCGRAQENENHYEVMKRIAYVSDVGRRREAFCLDMTERMQAYHREAMACLEEKARSLGLIPTCRKGCPHCCSQYIFTSLQEAEAIVYYLYRNPETFDLFVSRYQTWKTWPGRAAADHAVNRAFASNQDAPFEEALQVYLGLENPCPFLAEDTCAIYPVRPISCASIASFSPASCCRASSEPRCAGSCLLLCRTILPIWDATISCRWAACLKWSTGCSREGMSFCSMWWTPRSCERRSGPIPSSSARSASTATLPAQFRGPRSGLRAKRADIPWFAGDDEAGQFTCKEGQEGRDTVEDFARNGVTEWLVASHRRFRGARCGRRW